MKLQKDNYLMLVLFLYVFLVSIFNFSAVYLVGVILLCGIIFLNCAKKHKIIWNVYLTGQVVFIIYELIFILLGYSVDSKISYSVLTTVFMNFIISIAITNCFSSREKVFEFLKGFSVISLITLLLIIIITKGQGQDGRLAHNMPRPFSDTGFTAIEVGMIAVWGSISALYLYYKSKERKYLFFQVLYWIVIIWSGSRDCFAFGAVAIVLLYFFSGEKKYLIERIKKGFIICLIGIIAIISMLKVPKIYNVIGYRFIGFINKTETSANSRDTMKITAENLIENNYVLGYGLSTFQTFNGSFGTWAHNNYLELMVSGGIILTVIYYIPIIIIFYKIMKKKNKDMTDLVAIVLIILRLLHDIVGVTYLSRMGNIFLIVAIAALDKQTNQERNTYEKGKSVAYRNVT